jgi:hypothetical protein
MHRLLLLAIVAAGCGTESTLDITQFALTRGADDHVTAVIEATCQTYSFGDDACPTNGAPMCVRMNVFPAADTEPCVPTAVFDTVESCETVTLKGGATTTFTLTSSMAVPQSGFVADVLAEEPGDACQYGPVP